MTDREMLRAAIKQVATAAGGLTRARIRRLAHVVAYQARTFDV